MAPSSAREARIMLTSTAEAEEVVADAWIGRSDDGLHSAMIEALDPPYFLQR